MSKLTLSVFVTLHSVSHTDLSGSGTNAVLFLFSSQTFCLFVYFGWNILNVSADADTQQFEVVHRE
jgi:hypothetical protein